MSKFAYGRWVSVLAATAALGASHAATPDAGSDGVMVAEAVGATLGQVANVTLQFIQEDGPEAGHVRVVLTPDIRPLTLLEARSAAQQAFLEALGEPGLGDDLNRITVVVRLMPASYPDPSTYEHVIVYQRRGESSTWSVLPRD